MVRTTLVFYFKLASKPTDRVVYLTQHTNTHAHTHTNTYTHTHARACRLLDFAVVDGEGEAQPLERALLLSEPTFLVGLICPALEASSGA